MRPVSDFIDKWGLLDKLVGTDGGDSGQREGMYWALIKMMNPNDRSKYSRTPDPISPAHYKIVMDKIHPSPGVILRHCNPDYDASDWDRMSRDQLQPNIIAAGYWREENDNLRRLRNGHLRRGFIFTNNVRQNGATKRNHGSNGYSYAWKLPDITGPEIWGNFIRAFQAWWLWPILLVSDLELLGGAISWRWFRRHNIALNQTLSMMQAVDRLPTPFSWLATRIMPIERMIDYSADHLDDFHPDKDMQFMAEMMRDAWSNIKG